MHRSRSLLVAVLCSLLAACFEEPVREHLHVHVTPYGPVVLTAVQQVAGPEIAHGNPLLADRLDETRAANEQGWDRWSSSFVDLEPAAERFTLERTDGLVRRATRSAVVTSAPQLERFFASHGVTAVVATGSGIHELAFYPTGSTRATARQREDLERRVEGWSRAVAAPDEGEAELNPPRLIDKAEKALPR